MFSRTKHWKYTCRSVVYFNRRKKSALKVSEAFLIFPVSDLTKEYFRMFKQSLLQKITAVVLFGIVVALLPSAAFDRIRANFGWWRIEGATPGLDRTKAI